MKKAILWLRDPGFSVEIVVGSAFSKISRAWCTGSFQDGSWQSWTWRRQYLDAREAASVFFSACKHYGKIMSSGRREGGKLAQLRVERGGEFVSQLDLGWDGSKYWVKRTEGTELDFEETGFQDKRSAKKVFFDEICAVEKSFFD